MKRGIWILAGLVILAVGICVGSLVFAPRVAETPTSAVRGEAPEDVASTNCWLDEVKFHSDNVSDDMNAFSEAMGKGDFGAIRVQARLLESDLQKEKAALLACPTPKHRLLVSWREKHLRAIDLKALAYQYLEEGLLTLAPDLMSEGLDLLQETIDLSQEATSDIERYQVEVLGP